MKWSIIWLQNCWNLLASRQRSIEDGRDYRTHRKIFTVQREVCGYLLQVSVKKLGQDLLVSVEGGQNRILAA